MYASLFKLHSCARCVLSINPAVTCIKAFSCGSMSFVTLLNHGIAGGFV